MIAVLEGVRGQQSTRVTHSLSRVSPGKAEQGLSHGPRALLRACAEGAGDSLALGPRQEPLIHPRTRSAFWFFFFSFFAVSHQKSRKK